MSFISLILALALEQWRPLVDRRLAFAPASAYADFLERTFNAGEAQHGMIAWLLAAVPLTLLAWAAYAGLAWINPLAALAFNVVVLYFTIGFRQESHFFTDIHRALNAGDIETARRLLGEFRGQSCDGLSAGELARLTIESALAVSHRHVFGPMFWFVILPGPSGAVLYRMAVFLARRWGTPHAAPRGGESTAADLDRASLDADIERLGHEAGDERFGQFARQAFDAIDWLPVRITATAFAIVGDFEDAVYCWRTQAVRWADPLLGVVLAAGAGAMGVRLGMPVIRAGRLDDRPELGVGDDADSAFLDSTVGLVWRALVLWLVILLVAGLARAVA